MLPVVRPVADFQVYVAETNRLGNRGWVFRGHSSKNWQLEPSLARFLRTHQKNIKSTSHDIREADSVRKFQKAAHQFLSHLPKDTDWLSWLAIMQHFGAPTRLLDFTYSPYAALYFAAAGSVSPVSFNDHPTDAELDKKYEPFEIHALHLRSFRFLAMSVLGKKKKEPALNDYRIGAGRLQKKVFVGFFEGLWQNPRQVAQQGLFMIPSKFDMDIQAYLQTSPSTPKPHGNPWLVFRFPGGRIPFNNLVKNLTQANLTEATLFPGIEGVARSHYLRWYEVINRLA